jgi:hypothetical protein
MKEFLNHKIFNTAISIADFFAFIGVLAIVFYVFDSLIKYIPYLRKLKVQTWDKIADLLAFNSTRKKAYSLNIEYALNEVVNELKPELPQGWLKRARIEWARKSTPAYLRDKDLIIRIRPQNDQDLNYLNAIYYFFSSSIFPQTYKVIPLNIKRATSLYLSKRAIEPKRSFLYETFEKHFIESLGDDELTVASYFNDYINIDKYGFFNSAYIREVDTLASSLRISSERKQIEKEIQNIIQHLKKFENLSQKYLRKEDWYKYLSATSYGFILVANPEKQKSEGLDPYLNMARQRLRIGVKRLYVFGCHSERSFFYKVIRELNEIKEYTLVDSFKLHKDYRGEANGIGALFVINSVWEHILPKGDELEQEIEPENEKEIKIVSKAINPSVIINETELTKKIITLVTNFSKPDGWIFLGSLGDKIKKNIPLFNPYHYGCSSLRQLLQKLNVFDFREDGDGTAKAVYAKIKTDIKPPEEQNGTKNGKSKNSEVIEINPRNIVTEKLTQENIDNYLKQAVQAVADEEGWASIAEIGYYLHLHTPVNYHDFGFPKLKAFLLSRNIFEMKEIQKSLRAKNIDSAFFKVKKNKQIYN